eukprot:2041848-Amphidinium_carterae.1
MLPATALSSSYASSISHNKLTGIPNLLSWICNGLSFATFHFLAKSDYHTADRAPGLLKMSPQRHSQCHAAARSGLPSTLLLRDPSGQRSCTPTRSRDYALGRPKKSRRFTASLHGAQARHIQILKSCTLKQ